MTDSLVGGPHVPLLQVDAQTIAGHITSSFLHPDTIHSFASASKR